jgi:hypothetical protein
VHQIVHMTDFLTLLKRDHRDLERGLDQLLEASSLAEIRIALDGVRLGLTAHSEAEDIVLFEALARSARRDGLERVISHTRAAHLAQEGALAALVCATPGTSSWSERARHLRDLVRDHDVYEEAEVVPAIRDLAPAIYDQLAGAFATERLRQLAMLQPSAPLVLPADLTAIAG